MYLDNIDFEGIFFWYEDALEMDAEIKKKAPTKK